MRTRESWSLAATAALLGGGAVLAYHLTVTDRREREADRALAERNAAIDRDLADLQPVLAAAGTFLTSLDGEDSALHQPNVTTAAFQERHRATGGVLRLARPAGELFGAPDGNGPSYSDRWTGSLGGGAVACRGDVFRDGVVTVTGSYTIALTRDPATGRWLVDAFSVSR